MGNHKPQVPPAHDLCCPPGTIRMAQAVEAVATDAPLACPFPRHRVGTRSLGQSCVESSVKGRYLGNPRQSLFRRCNAGQTGRVVERSEFCQLFARPLDLGGDKYGAAIAFAAMDNTMSHS